MFSRAKIKAMSVILILGLMLLGVACQQSGEVPRGKEQIAAASLDVAKIGIAEEIASLDPHKIKSYVELQVARALYEGLFTAEQDTGRIVPLLVEHYELSPDGRIYTFRLHKGIRFHSGRELIADDVKFSWERVLLHTQSSELTNALGLIGGANDYRAGKTGTVAGMVTIDSHTLQIELSQPYQQFLLALTHPAAVILDQQVLNLIGEGYGEPGTHQSPSVALVGTGPFSVVEWIGGHQITFQNFEQYHGSISDIKRLEFVQYPDLEALYTDFQGAYLDLVVAPSLHKGVEIPENQIISLLGNQFFYLVLNNLKKPFDNSETRKAVSLAMNRKALAEEFEGIALEGLLPRYLFQGRPPYSNYKYEPGQGKEMLTQEIISYSQEEPLILTFLAEGEWEKIAIAVQKQLAQVGLSVELQGLSIDEFTWAIDTGQATCFLDSWQGSLSSSQFFLESYFASWGLANKGRFFDPLIEEKLVFIQENFDSDKERLESLLEVEEKIQAKAPLISLWQTTRYIAYQDELADLPISPLGLITWEKISLKE